MALPSMMENELHNIGERINQTGKLRKEDKEALHNIRESLSADEITKAIKILLQHDPVTRRMNELTRQSAHDTWSNMTMEEQEEFIQKRIASTQSRRKERLAEQEQIKEDKKAELENLIQSVKAIGLRPMFTHYYEDLEFDWFHGECEESQERLAATSCVLLDENGTAVAKGIALISFDDNGSKLEGRLLSLGRAKQAFDDQKDRFPIARLEAELILETLGVEAGDWYSKAVYRPEDLSFIELERIARQQGILEPE